MIHRIISLPKKESFFLFGSRQTGKTTLIHTQYIKSIWTIDLLLNDVYFIYSKDPSRFRKEAIQKITREHIKIIFIDEIQRIPLLLNEVQYLMQNYSCQFILTGSSARKLKRGGANLLGGRAIERRLFPFVYEELKEQFHLEKVLRFGSLPPVVTRSKEQCEDFLSSYVHTYIKEEIQSEGLARNIGSFSKFLDMAASQFAELLSYSSIARECHLPVKTVQSYYEILEDTLIGIRLLSWQKSLRKRLVSHPKFYLFDLGVTNAINKQLTGVIDRKVEGRLFEQFIILETYRAIHYQRSEANIYFWRTNHGAEVDLLIEKHGKITGAFEIKFTPNVDGSHLSGLRAFREENPKIPCHVISTVENAFEINDIKILPFKTYLGGLKDIISV